MAAETAVPTDRAPGHVLQLLLRAILGCDPYQDPLIGLDVGSLTRRNPLLNVALSTLAGIDGRKPFERQV